MTKGFTAVSLKQELYDALPKQWEKEMEGKRDRGHVQFVGVSDSSGPARRKASNSSWVRLLENAECEVLEHRRYFIASSTVTPHQIAYCS